MENTAKNWISRGLGLAIALASIGWILYSLQGHALVRAIYEGAMPIDALNHLFKNRDVNELSYYLSKTDAISSRLLYFAMGCATLLGAHLWLHHRHPTTVICRPWPNLLLVCTALHWLIYILQIPTVHLLPYWFWPLASKALPNIWVLMPLALFAFWVTHTVSKYPYRKVVNLVLICALGIAVQHGFAWMEGRGLNGLRDRLVHTGHAAFVETAEQQRSFWRVATQYETLVQNGELSHAPHATKPPGLLLFLILTERVSHFVMPETDDHLTAFASLIFPVIAALGAIPLYFLSRYFLDDHVAWTPPLIYLLTPGFALITLHADQFLHPLFAIAIVWLYLMQRPVCAFVAGLCLYLAIFTSFALLGLWPMLLVLAISMYRRTAHWRPLAWLICGHLIAGLIFYVAFNYNPIVRYEQAIAAHQNWKVPVWNAGFTLYFAFLNALEFAIWCGIPIVVLFCADLAKNLRKLLPDGELTMALIATLTLLALFGKTAAETARLWLFFMPFFAIVAIKAWLPLWPMREKRGMALLVALQMISVLVIKKYQDFY